MSEVKLDLKATLDSASVGIASRGLLQPPNGDYLPPRLWDALRQRLQSIFRRATGEPNATLVLLPEGARILAPGELDRETLERAAEVAGGNYRDHGKTFGTQRARNYEHAGKTIASAIRALSGKAGEA